MRKQVSDSEKDSRGTNRTFIVLIIISGVLLLAGTVLLMIEPVKSMMREKITDEAINVMEEEMSRSDPSGNGEDEEIEATFIVPRDGNEAAGEEYDYFGDNKDDREAVKSFIASREAKLPKNVTLHCIGVIKIEKIGKKLPVWSSTSTVALRYGAGLYEGSVKPGQNGNAAILGHNMKNSTLFSKLYKCEVGDPVKFIRLDGTVLEFRIDKIEIVYKTKLLKYVEAEASETPQLTLVTCANDTGQGNRRVLICHPVK